MYTQADLLQASPTNMDGRSPFLLLFLFALALQQLGISHASSTSMGGLFSTAGAAAAAEETESAVVAVHSASEWAQTFQSHCQTDKLMVIDFSATWCPPCRFIEPSFRSMANQYTGAVFLKIDVDELPEVSREWQVQAMPTFVLVRGGREVGRIVGARKDELEKQVQNLLSM